jgi:CheY-like chemotaxis protein
MSTSEQVPPRSSDEGGGWPPFRVLCVDDNRDVADSTAMLLQAVGFEVCACYDGPSALQMAETFRPSVCLLDLNMPGMCGDEVAVHLRQQASWQPLLLVAVTAMSNKESVERIRKAGFDMHLVKPISLHQLIGVVDALFRLAEAARAALNRK